MSDRARLRWRCRRGMRELDALMLAWLDTHYESADESVRARFEALLEMQDPDIMGLLKQIDTSEVKGFDGHPANQSESGKDSSFETIIRQARQAAKKAANDAARDAARQATSQAAKAKN